MPTLACNNEISLNNSQAQEKNKTEYWGSAL